MGRMRNHPIFKHYVKTALWSSTGDDDKPLDNDHSISDIDESTLNEMERDVASFIAKCNAKGLHDVIFGDEDGAGHDFWLTRNGHGAGFWDGDWPEGAGEELTDISHKFGNYTLYIGDDGVIYGMKG